MPARYTRSAPVLPTVDQFSSFTETVSHLKNNDNQCIWYLPDKQRLCLVRIPPEDNQDALKKANSIWISRLSAKSSLKDLEQIAQSCCCPRHHRNKFEATGLANKLATRWYSEIQSALKITAPLAVVKTEVLYKSVASIPVAFSKHQIHESESLFSSLWSDINLDACKSGSLYIYSHAGDAFHGMVKIGYTGKTIDSRLIEWADCGHGYPKLLDSFNNVRHPERVELLVHFELEEYWHQLKWCTFHQKSHIEWFKIDRERAAKTARLWCKWMGDANPYDRRGHLTTRWRSHVEFLIEHDNPITAEAMVQIQRIEEGSKEVYDFIDDKALRKGRATTILVKEEEKTPVKKEEDPPIKEEEDESTLVNIEEGADVLSFEKSLKEALADLIAFEDSLLAKQQGGPLSVYSQGTM